MLGGSFFISFCFAVRNHTGDLNFRFSSQVWSWVKEKLEQLSNIKAETFGGFTLQALLPTPTISQISIYRLAKWNGECPPLSQTPGKAEVQSLSRESWDVSPQSGIIPTLYSMPFQFGRVISTSSACLRCLRLLLNQSRSPLEPGSRDIHTMTLDCWACLDLRFLTEL